MFIYKLSPTRAVAHMAKYDTDLYQGSSINRKKNDKKTIEKNAFAAIEIDDLEGSSTPLLCHNKVHQRQIAEQGVSSICNQQLAPLPLQRLRKLSTRSKYKIRDKLESLYNASNGAKFTFLTLTFIAKVDDKTAQRCLNKFLNSTRKRFGKFSYLWVAERQEDTKNIHFHIFSDKFFPIEEFNALWILQQYNAGIVHPDYTLQQIMTNRLAGTLQKILNPVDVKAVKSIDGLSIYLTMYVTKNTDTFRCSVWHCCRQVSRLFTSQLIDQDTFYQAQQPEINFGVNVNTGEVYETKTFVTEHAIVVNILNKKHFRKKLTDINTLNSWILKGKVFKDVPTVSYLDYHQIFRNDFIRPSVHVITAIKALCKKRLN